jgi:hypothetical protein
VVRAEDPVDSLAVLERTLNKPGLTTISVVKTNASRELHYCPDNTCDVFKAPVSAPPLALADFAFAYIFYASGYTYLEDFVTKTGGSHSKVILNQNRSGCKEGHELELASCVLRHLARQHSIRVFQVREDEGARTETAVNLQAALSVNALKRTRAWQLGQWRGHP